MTPTILPGGKAALPAVYRSAMDIRNARKCLRRPGCGRARRCRDGQESPRQLDAFVGALHRAGVRIIAGTDQTVPGYSLYRERGLSVQTGVTPLEAIQAATLVPGK